MRSSCSIMFVPLPKGSGNWRNSGSLSKLQVRSRGHPLLPRVACSARTSCRCEGDTCRGSALLAAVRSAGGLGAGRPSPTDVWLYLESDAEALAAPAADNEGTADQMLSGLLEFLELLAVPFGHFPSR